MLKLERQIRSIGGIILVLAVGFSQAAGFGVIQVQSSLGEPLNLNVTVIGTDTSPQWYACIKARVESLDGTVAFVPKIDLRTTNQRQSIQLTSHQYINEPAMNVVLKLGCEISVSRTYQILLDPVAFMPNIDLPAQAAVLPSATYAEKVKPTEPEQSNQHIDANKVKLRQPHEDKIRIPSDKKIALAARPSSAAKANKIPTNRLSLTLLDNPTRVSANLKSLPPPQKDTPTAKLSVNKPVFVSATSDLTVGDLSDATQMAMIKSLQIEIDALRNENDRIKQKGATDIAAVQSVRSELFSWLAGLGLILMMCFAAILWLTARFMSLRKVQNQSPWNPVRETPIYPTKHQASEVEKEEENASEVMQNSVQHTRKEKIQVDVKPNYSNPKDDSNRLQEDVVHLQQLYQRHKVISAREAAIEKMPLKANDITTDTEKLEATRGVGLPDKVEEISEVMELVGAWMALHKPVEVLKLLEPFDHVATPESPLPWMCLLDVYNSMNDQEKYEAIGKRLVALFNVKVAPWEARSVIGRANLANFPHVVNKILALWDSDEVVPYLASLLVNDREGTRVGFDLAIYRDIERLHALAKDPSRPRDIDKLRNYKAGAILFAPPPGLDEADEIFSTPQGEPDTDVLTNNEYVSKLPKRARYVSDYHYGGHYDGFSGDGSLNSTVEVARSNSSDEFSLDEPIITIPQNNSSQIIGTNKSLAFLMNEPEFQGDDINPAGEEQDAASIAQLSPIIVKLKLAIAYQDIGDSEGAVFLLEEVIKEGSDEEAEQARMMLALMNDTTK